VRLGKGAVGVVLLGLLAASCAAADRLDALPEPVRSTGTGFFATPAGDLFTAAHVVEGCLAL
jgi:hypothetical protein